MTIVAWDVGPVGGMEMQLTQLISGLLRRDFAVTVISSRFDLPPHPKLRWVRVPGPVRPFTLAYPWFLLMATLLVRLRGRGIVHSTGAMTLSRAQLSTVHYCHAAASGLDGLERGAKPHPLYRLNAWIADRLSVWVERWCYSPRQVGALVAVSHGVVRELDEHYPKMRDKVKMIPNGVDTERFAPGPGGPADDLAVVFVGGDWERKGLKFAIEAVALAPGTALTVVGPGDQASYLALAERLGVADRVTFVGPSPDTSAWYAKAEVFLLPTGYEAAPLVTYEAAASGLPLLVTPVNGVEDLLKEGHNGWFIERDAEQIAGRLRALVEDPRLRAEVGRNARSDSFEFSWEHVVDEYVALYAQLS